ncbi:MAG TPA: transcription-repair coupling factor [Anaerolineae bacterium]|nr:transcription-repair coupling factor [Anaerolineae bacterium]
MLDSILKSFKKHPSFVRARDDLERERSIMVHGCGGSSNAFFIAALLSNEHSSPNRSILVVFPHEDEAEIFRTDIEAILGTERITSFPERDVNPYEHADSHCEVRCRRVETLDLLDRGWHGVIVTSIGAILDPTTPPGLINLISYEVRKGDIIAFDEFIRSVVRKGFKKQYTVSSAGQISVRGGIIDIFPFGCDAPYRIEFWGDEIESIRTFSTTTQRSLEQVESFRIIPSDEFVTEAGINAEDELRLTMIEQKAGIDLSRIRRVFGGDEKPNGIEQYLNVIFNFRASLLSYLSNKDIAYMVDPDRCVYEMESRLNRAEKIWEHQRNDDHDLPPVEYYYRSPKSLMENIKKLLVIYGFTLRPAGQDVIEFSITLSRQYQGNLKELKNDIQTAHLKGMGCYILCDNTGQAERLNDLLDEIFGDYTIELAHLTGGFTDTGSGLMVFTDHEIFGRHRREVQHRRFKEGIHIPDHRALKLGDYVVHVDYGIGKYMGLKRLKIGGSETDCLVIHYREGDQLLLPVGQLARLKKFTSQEGVVPVISKLGGTSWEKLKDRTKKSIQRMAEDLLHLYAERKAYPGFAFKSDEPMLTSLEDSFVYEETPDQLRSWREVRIDMEKPVPMERLICGDVGFGKTEIAMRAAFLAALNGKQVAVLVPTTILAEQHEETFQERFADFPVHIKSLSRFRTRAEQKAIIERLARGDIDIIIGTHRLLSRDVHIKNLGLLIIDEEQQFGVRHKERLKKFRRNVDVLTISATPIPRTLNMSLMGSRDISYMNTPPRDRYSVHTEILPFEEKYVVEAVLREIERDGQIFFIHNRVKSIISMTTYLTQLLPGVSFGIAHGQLPEKELAKVMKDFHQKKFQVLVSTMIVENGLDIPSVNTILINRADTFGLAQLYQLRGRVGRSNKRAFAYLLVPPKTSLSGIARQRLSTIEEFVELGSGFNIAMRDLEIRGAGNILGVEQSGFISALGFDLYMDLLRETISELKGEKIEKPPEVEVHIQKDAYIPEEFVPDAAERILFYRRLSETVSVDDVKAIEDEMADRFGRLSEPVINLLDTAFIRHYAALIGASEVIISQSEVTMNIPESIELTRETIEKMVKTSPVKLHFSFHEEGMQVSYCFLEEMRGPLEGAKKVLQVLSA